MKKIEIMVTAVISVLMSRLGILAIPVFLLVGCNLLDYVTGLLAAPYRTENISSYKGIRGIVKKVCMWLLIVVGAWVDILVNYAFEYAGIPVVLPFIVSIAVAVWLVVNEIISILENMTDIGISLPPFLMPIVRHIKEKTEEACGQKEQEKKDEECDI